jgi:hypothetical protein
MGNPFASEAFKEYAAGVEEWLDGPAFSASNNQMLRKFGAGNAVIQLAGKLVPVIAGQQQLLETVHKGMAAGFEQLESFLEDRFDRRGCQTHHS